MGDHHHQVRRRRGQFGLGGRVAQGLVAGTRRCRAAVSRSTGLGITCPQSAVVRLGVHGDDPRPASQARGAGRRPVPTIRWRSPLHEEKACRRLGSRESSPLAVLFFQLLLDPVALEAGQVIDEQLAVEVIALVLDAHGESSLRRSAQRLPSRVPAF